MFAGFVFLTFSIDFVNLFDTTAGKHVPAAVILGMSLLQLPDLAFKLLPFAVLLGDVIMESAVPATRELVEIYEATGSGAIHVERVPREDISSYGVIDIEPNVSLGDGIYQVRDLVEKPPREEAPSDLAIIGRYVLTPEVFESIEAIEPGSGGEIQLTDALKHLLRNRPIYGYRFEGTRYDAGDKLGFLKATVEFALHRHDLGGAFREYLKGLKL